MTTKTNQPTLEFPLETDSIAIPMSLRTWQVVVVVALLVVIAVPRFMARVERFKPTRDWRTPVAVTEDYWQWSRWKERAESQGDVLVVGDSVVWGEFAKPSETLSAQLSVQAQATSNSTTFANLGLKGLYPIALRSLLQHSPPRGRTLVWFNPIWMTSPRRDLQESNPDGLNHTQLVPIWNSPPADTANLEQRLGRWTGLRFEPWRWREHWKLDDLEGRDFATWSIKHPNRWPWQATDWSVQIPLDAPQSALPMRRASEGTRPERLRSYDWVSVDESLQAGAFEGMIADLAQRDVEFCVVVGRLSPAGRTQECVEREREIAQAIAERCEALGVLTLFASAEEAWMADASHPSPEGYRVQAQELWSEPKFRDWALK